MADMIPKLRSWADSPNLIGPQRGILLVAAQHIEELQGKLAAAEKREVGLRRLLEKAWNVVDDLDTQCASDMATGCWPAKLGYSEEDVRRINKEIEGNRD